MRDISNRPSGTLSDRPSGPTPPMVPVSKAILASLELAGAGHEVCSSPISTSRSLVSTGGLLYWRHLEESVGSRLPIKPSQILDRAWVSLVSILRFSGQLFPLSPILSLAQADTSSDQSIFRHNEVQSWDYLRRCCASDWRKCCSGMSLFSRASYTLPLPSHCLYS